METKKYAPKFFCEKCNYTTNKKSCWTQHIATRKHNKETQETKKYAPRIMKCEVCNMEFKGRSGLWKHKKICFFKIEPKEEKEEKKIDNLEGMNQQELIDVVKKNMEKINDVLDNQNKLMETIDNQNKIIHNMVPKVGTTNNFNINVFLNEDCKNAINMSDFIKSLQIEIADLTYTNHNGLIEGVSSVMVNGLKQLQLCERPIHCTDPKRETLYIKENDSWEKEEKKDIIKSGIDNVVKKQQKAINKWLKSNPNWKDTEQGKAEYLDLVKTVMGDELDSDDSKNRVIKTIMKETVLDKSEL
tara:strand:+ start:66 stop:968 length:903 start_codon:yes stop_codon:yes gene_type:complete